MSIEPLLKLIKWAEKNGMEEAKKLASISSLYVNSINIKPEDLDSDFIILNLQEMEGLVDPKKTKVFKPQFDVSFKAEGEK
jgi:hypothetical protein